MSLACRLSLTQCSRRAAVDARGAQTCGLELAPQSATVRNSPSSFSAICRGVHPAHLLLYDLLSILSSLYLQYCLLRPRQRAFLTLPTKYLLYPTSSLPTAMTHSNLRPSLPSSCQFVPVHTEHPNVLKLQHSHITRWTGRRPPCPYAAVPLRRRRSHQVEI